MNPAIMFVGPSLWGSALHLPRDIVRLPPARCGDLVRALNARPRAIGLIDGRFETMPSVWHKEVLHVMAQGVPVLGAASLGALRAAELAPFGMRGIGAIHAGFLDGRIERDDAVMVSHAPAALGYRPLTVALVDAEAAVARSAMPPDDAALLLRLARRMNFRDRTWPALRSDFSAITGRPCPPLDETISLKREDAETLIQRLADPIAPIPQTPPPMTIFLRRLIDGEIRPARPASTLP